MVHKRPGRNVGLAPARLVVEAALDQALTSVPDLEVRVVHSSLVRRDTHVDTRSTRQL